MTPAVAPVLRFDGLAGGYGDTRVLHGVSGQVAAGQVLGIMGRNGVGKTTLMRLLMGYLPVMTAPRPAAARQAPRGGEKTLGRPGGVDLGAPIPAAARQAPRGGEKTLGRPGGFLGHGQVWLAGQCIDTWPTHRRQRAGMSHVPQERLVFDPLSVRENLTLHRASRSLDDYAPMFEAFPRIRERLELPAGRLSGGEKKLVALARALAERAPVTLLDEPSEGVQQENIDRMAALIAERRRQGAAFIIVEQNLSFLCTVMDEVLVLDHGEVVLAGPAAGYAREDLLRHLHV